MVENVLVFSKPARLGGQVQNVPFSDVAWQVARLLDLHHDDRLALQLCFHMNGHVTLIIGWPEPEFMHLPFDSGPTAEFGEILTLVEKGIAEGSEDNPTLVTFSKAMADQPASWALASEESVKFPLRDDDLRAGTSPEW